MENKTKITVSEAESILVLIGEMTVENTEEAENEEPTEGEEPGEGEETEAGGLDLSGLADKLRGVIFSDTGVFLRTL